MTNEALEARRAYKRKWNREHPENVKAAQRRYWEKKAAEAEPAQAETATAPEPAEAQQN